MAGRTVSEIIQLLGRGLLEDMPASARRTATRDIERSAAPVTRLPRAGETVTVRGLPPSRQPTKDMLDPNEYGSGKLSRPIEAYGARVTPHNVPLLPRKELTMEDLQNSYLLGLWGDKSSGEGILSGVGDITLQRGYRREGGADYMRGQAQQDDRSIWGSGSGVMKPLAETAEQVAQETGRPVHGVTVSMRNESIDFQTGPARVANDLLQQSVSRKDAGSFDDALRMRKGMQDWPGIHSPDADQWLFDATPDQRKAFMTLVEAKQGAIEGIPSDAAAAARYAMTDEKQLDLPSGVAGVSVGRFDATDAYNPNPTYIHSSFPTSGRGTYVGGLDMLIPQTELLRDAFAQMSRPDYVSPAGKVGALPYSNAISMAKFTRPTQFVDQKMVDDYMTRRNFLKAEGLLP